MTEQAMGKGGLAVVTVLAVAMSAVAFFLGNPEPLTGDPGLCLPSPNRWNLAPASAWLVNIGLIVVCAASLGAIDRRYSIVPGAAPVLPGLFLVMATSIPWIGNTLNSSAIVALGMLGCLAILCSCYDSRNSRNATQPLFVAATILSVGSMVQYAFIFMTVPVLVIAAIFKCLRFREFTAFILGVAAPYWIVLGFGIVPVGGLTVPTLTNLFAGDVPKGALFVGVINLGVTAVVGVILALYNGIKLYAGNTRRRMMNVAVYVIGAACIICMVLDFNNLTAYALTFYMVAALQWADLYALWNFHQPWVGVMFVCMTYAGMFATGLLC